MKSVKIFATVEPYELTKIMDAVKPAEYKAGETIIKEVLFIGRGEKFSVGRGRKCIFPVGIR